MSSQLIQPSPLTDWEIYGVSMLWREKKPGIPSRKYWVYVIKEPNQMVNRPLNFEAGNGIYERKLFIGLISRKLWLREIGISLKLADMRFKLLCLFMFLHYQHKFQQKKFFEAPCTALHGYYGSLYKIYTAPRYRQWNFMIHNNSSLRSSVTTQPNPSKTSLKSKLFKIGAHFSNLMATSIKQ